MTKSIIIIEFEMRELFTRRWKNTRLTGRSNEGTLFINIRLIHKNLVFCKIMKNVTCINVLRSYFALSIFKFDVNDF